MDKLEIAKALKGVNYECDKLSHLRCTECYFFTVGCHGLGARDRIVDRIIEKVDDVIKNSSTEKVNDVIRKASDVDTVLTESISVKKTNKYHLIRR